MSADKHTVHMFEFFEDIVEVTEYPFGDSERGNVEIKMTPVTPETCLVTTDANKDVMRFIFMSENLRCVVELPWRGDVLEKIEKEIGERFNWDDGGGTDAPSP